METPRKTNRKSDNVSGDNAAMEKKEAADAVKKEEENTKPEPQAKSGKKMFHRVVTGVLLAVGTITLIVIHPLPISIQVLVFSLIGLNEFYHMAERKNIRPSRAVGYISVTVLMMFAYLGKDEKRLVPLLIGITMIAMLGYIFRKGFHVSSFFDVGVTVLGILYVGWFFSYFVLLRRIEGAPLSFFGKSIERGAGFVLLLLFSTSFTDIGAFFVGKYMGKHKLAPHISPKKTVEGAVGGMLGAVAGAFLIGKLLKMHDMDLLTVGLLCGIFAQLGDIWASILKRDVGVKDSGAIFKGHGGMLDRCDSFLFTSPIIYFYLKFFY